MGVAIEFQEFQPRSHNRRAGVRLGGANLRRSERGGLAASRRSGAPRPRVVSAIMTPPQANSMSSRMRRERQQRRQGSGFSL